MHRGLSVLTPGAEGLLQLADIRRFEIAVDQTGPPVPADVHLDDRRRVAGELDLHLYGVVPYFSSEHRVVDGSHERTVRRFAVLEGERLVGFEQDISQVRWLEQRTRLTERSVTRLVEELSDAALILREGRIIFANSHARALLRGAHHAHDAAGDEPDPLAGQPILTWIAPEHTPAFCGLLAGHHSQAVQVRIDVGEGSVTVEARAEAFTWLGTVAQLVRLCAPPPPGLRAPEPARITQPGTTQPAVLPAAPAQSSAFDVRAHEAERLASLGALAAAVAHEVNNPLSAMALQLEHVEVGLEQLAVRSSSAQALLPALRDAIEAARRVRDVILDLRAFSGARSARPHPVDLDRVVALAVNLSRHEIRHSAEVTVELGDHGPVVADEGRLSQAILQVLVDAARAIATVDGPRGLIQVTSAGEGDEIVLSIRDDGPAPTREELAEMFEPAGATRAGGLGLSVARSAVVQVGGSMSARRLHPTGCEVRIRLPCGVPAIAQGSEARRLQADADWRAVAIPSPEPVFHLDPAGDALFDGAVSATDTSSDSGSDATSDVEPDAAHTGPAEAHVNGVGSRADGDAHHDVDFIEVSPPAPSWARLNNSGRVLLADDEPAIARGVSAALRRSHEVVVCRDGLEAIAALEQGDYELILCDLMMPGLGGDGVFSWLRAHRPELEDRFVIITGGAVTAATASFLESGQCRVLHKPFEARALRALLTPLPRATGRFDASGGLADRDRYSSPVSSPQRQSASAPADNAQPGPIVG